MYKLTRISLLMVAFICVQFSAYSQRVEQIRGRSAGHADLILPQATFELDVPVITATYTAGKLYSTTTAKLTAKKIAFYQSQYGVSPKVLKLLKTVVVDTNGERVVKTYKIFEDSMKLIVIPRPDYNKRFAFTKLKKWNANQGLTLNYNDDGVTTDGDYSYENKTFDLVVKGVGGVASIVGKFLGRGGEKENISLDASIPELDNILADFKVLYNPGGSAMTYEIFKDMKTSLEKKYDEAFSKYFYSSEKTLRTIQIFYTPPAPPALPTPPSPIITNICRLDNNNGRLMLAPGIQSNTEVIGKQYAFDVSSSAGHTYYNISVAARPNTYQITEYTQSRSSTASSMPYNICIRATVTLLDPNSIQLYQSFAKIPQYGTVGYINIKKPNKITWQYDTWGELKKISVSGNAATTDQIGSLQALAEQIKSTAKPDELTDLTKKVDLIKKRKEYEDLLKEQLSE